MKIFLDIGEKLLQLKHLPNQLLLQDESILNTFKEVMGKYFSENEFRVLRCKKLLKDVTKCKKIEKEHKRNNHNRGINGIFAELKTRDLSSCVKNLNYSLGYLQ